jgi:pimeloyl-ACP methyl ester carboxylesterase
MPNTVTSADGTAIAYEKVGQGPALILVGGAASSREAWAPLAQLLAAHFSVYYYDRRGRGDSSDTAPYAVEKEVADISALIEAAGGSVFLCGTSSGAALALEAAIRLGSSKVKKLAVYEVPYDSSQEGVRAWREFVPQLTKLLSSGDKEGALTHFMRFVGAPEQVLEAMRAGPQWAAMVKMAPTLAYDVAVVGKDRVVPAERAARIAVPVLIMDGEASQKPMPFMRASADELGRAIPGAKRVTLEGQGHAVDAKALAPVLKEFFGTVPEGRQTP